MRRAVSGVQQAAANIADTCLSAVQQQCGNADNTKQCLQQKNASLPQPCQTIVAALEQGRQALATGMHERGGQAQAQMGEEQGGQQQTAEAQDNQNQGHHLRGLPAFSSDGKNLGQVVRVERGPDGKIQSIHIQAGRLLGLGEKTIAIDGSKVERLLDRVRIMMTGDQIRNLPDAKDQGGGAQR